MERIMREIRRRTRVVGNFPDGNSALMLVTSRLRYIAGKQWGTKRYMNMDLLFGGAIGYQILDACGNDQDEDALEMCKRSSTLAAPF